KDNTMLSEAVTASIDEDNKTISATFPNGTDITALTPSIEVSELATISPTGIQDFTSSVTYTVTAEDESTTTYTVSISVAKSNAKQILGFMFTIEDNTTLSEVVTASIDEDNKTISAAFPNGTDITALTPSIEVSELATISPAGAQDFTSPVTYTVTAADESTVDYTVSISVNALPNAFTLTAPVQGATDVSPLPTFSWDAATDPDGDTVSYNLYLGTAEDTMTLYVENLSHTSFEVTSSLNPSQTYYWQVEAIDDKEGKISSSIHSFTVLNLNSEVTLITTNAAFSERYGHSTVVFNNKMWIIGGRDKVSSNYLNDVWYSTDGVTWTEATDSANFDGRHSHTSFVFDNKIWVIGGRDTNLDRLNDVWYSTDGVNWTEATDEAEFDIRSKHTSIVHDNKMWVIGGYGGAGINWLNDVWYSTDGVNWTEATDDAGFNPIYAHTSVTFDNKIWVIAGYDPSQLDSRKNDVWYSTDGVTWTEATDDAGFIGRTSHSSVVFDNKIWVIGGHTGDALDDVWYSVDGFNWAKADDSSFTGRYNHSTVVFNNKMWVIGGNAGYVNGSAVYLNDVWAFSVNY
ncbi:MAG: Kelch repeat-containing protein, partial [Cellulophaga fucicola]